MIILNNLTKSDTCDSIEIIAHEKYVATVVYKKGKLEVTEHKAGKTLRMERLGIVDNGISFVFQAYNNKIKVLTKPDKVYRGPE